MLEVVANAGAIVADITPIAFALALVPNAGARVPVSLPLPFNVAVDIENAGATVLDNAPRPVIVAETP